MTLTVNGNERIRLPIALNETKTCYSPTLRPARTPFIEISEHRYPISCVIKITNNTLAAAAYSVYGNVAAIVDEFVSVGDQFFDGAYRHVAYDERIICHSVFGMDQLRIRDGHDCFIIIT